MANENSQNINYLFFNDKEVNDVFAEIDYELKNGVHFQSKHPKQEKKYNFINRHYKKQGELELKDYYFNLYGINLEVKEDADNNSYYFLDFIESGKGKLSKQKITYLSEEYILIGLLLWIIHQIYGNSMNSCHEFYETVIKDYEDFKEDLFRTILNYSKDNSMFSVNNKFEDKIYESIEKFGELGWIYLHEDKNTFQIMPSFERIIKMNINEIQTAREILESKKKKNEQ